MLRTYPENFLLIKVSVKANAKQPRVEALDESTLIVYVDELAVEGRANKRLLEILSDHYNVPKSQISIVRGAKSAEKIVELP